MNKVTDINDTAINEFWLPRGLVALQHAKNNSTPIVNRYNIVKTYCEKIANLFCKKEETQGITEKAVVRIHETIRKDDNFILGAGSVPWHIGDSGK
jgi:hypothetical protein